MKHILSPEERKCLHIKKTVKKTFKKKDIIETIRLEKTASNKDYKSLCEITKQFNCFKACGNLNDKWVIVKFNDVSHKNKFYDLLRK